MTDDISIQIMEWAKKFGYECEIFSILNVYFLYKNDELLTWYPDPNAIVGYIQWVLRFGDEIDEAMKSENPPVYPNGMGTAL